MSRQREQTLPQLSSSNLATSSADMSKIKFSDKPISMEESLKDIMPIDWSDDVLTGKKKVVIKKQK